MSRRSQYVVGSVVLVVLGALVSVVGQGAGQVITLPAEGYLPATTIIKRNVDPRAQLCAERLEGDGVDCRAIAEVRKWLHERATVLK